MIYLITQYGWNSNYIEYNSMTKIKKVLPGAEGGRTGGQAVLLKRRRWVQLTVHCVATHHWC